MLPLPPTERVVGRIGLDGLNPSLADFAYAQRYAFPLELSLGRVEVNRHKILGLGARAFVMTKNPRGFQYPEVPLSNLQLQFDLIAHGGDRTPSCPNSRNHFDAKVFPRGQWVADSTKIRPAAPAAGFRYANP